MMPPRPDRPASSSSQTVGLCPTQQARLAETLADLGQPLALVQKDGQLQLLAPAALASPSQIVGWLPPLGPTSLGDPGFAAGHRARSNLVVGAMANGISSVPMVQAAARAGYLAVFGAAGLSLARVRAALSELSASLEPQSLPWGCNLIYTPHESGWEREVVDLCVAHKVPTVSASAYLDLSPQILRARALGMRTDSAGQIVAPRRLIVKLSRVELARKFLAPPPQAMLQRLVQSGDLSEQEAKLAALVSVATDITVEADSGGHTDNRPSLAQFPAIEAEKRRIALEHPCASDVRLGAAGGLGTPAAIAAAFSMGAAYVLCGSVFQACVESGSSEPARAMLAACGQADVAMAPAADMFEMGIKLQVLKRGTMFAMRAQKLYDLYRSHESYEQIPQDTRAWVEDKLFRASASDIWSQCIQYWQARSPDQLVRADKDPKHRMALMFRWYLGQGSRWANQGDPSRKADYQIWCGPAMGAFNAWAQSTPLQAPDRRHVAHVADALMLGAAWHLRAYMASAQGLALSLHDLAQIERNLLFPAT